MTPQLLQLNINDRIEQQKEKRRVSSQYSLFDKFSSPGNVEGMITYKRAVLVEHHQFGGMRLVHRRPALREADCRLFVVITGITARWRRVDRLLCGERTVDGRDRCRM